MLQGSSFVSALCIRVLPVRGIIEYGMTMENDLHAFVRQASAKGISLLHTNFVTFVSFAAFRRSPMTWVKFDDFISVTRREAVAR